MRGVCYLYGGVRLRVTHYDSYCNDIIICEREGASEREGKGYPPPLPHV